jgi:succinyl-diaminopimelate desuccinylase
MKGALAVMVELALAGVDAGFVFFGREELPVAESALTPLLAREDALRAAELAVVMEPTANRLQAGCVGNIMATLVAHGSAATALARGRPTTRSTAWPRASRRSPRSPTRSRSSRGSRSPRRCR